MTVDYCDKYKYFGVLFSTNNNMDEHKQKMRKKTEAACNTGKAIAGSTDLKKVELKVMRDLVETCILPIIMYGWEATNSRKEDEKRLKQIVDSLIKRILITSLSTIWESLFTESGILEVRLTITRNRLNNMHGKKSRTTS